MDRQLQELNDRINFILYSITGSIRPFTIPGRQGDIGFQFRHAVAAMESWRIQSGYQRVAYDSFTVSGTLIVSGDLVVI